MLLPALHALLHLPLLTAAYSWKFQSPPQQCTNLTVQVTGNDGKPPYHLLIIPYGPSPFTNTEVRKIIDQNFTGTEVTVPMNWPANSQLVAIVGDSNGFATGGTSAAAIVTSSNDNTCFDPSKGVSPLWAFDIQPGLLTQCQPSRILWQTDRQPQGTPTFLGVIPGGESFTIPVGKTDNQASNGLGIGFSWTVNIRGSTNILIVAGDDRGKGTGGSASQTISNGPNDDNSCLNDQSPSSTPGTPAGGSYPTDVNGSTTPGGSGGKSSASNTGAIVGGVIGGLVLIVSLILLLIFFRRRAKVHREQREKPDLLVGDEGDDSEANRQGAPSRNELPQYYQPEPFMIPDPTAASATETDDGRRTSFISSQRSGTPDLLSATGTSGPGSTSAGYSNGKKGPMRGLRPVNIIQHDDAGPSTPMPVEDAETIELPPAYTNIKKNPSAIPDPPAGGNPITTQPHDTTP